jgi:antitoxin component YwqK of YwqJK toxin-antitoxin module
MLHSSQTAYVVVPAKETLLLEVNGRDIAGNQEKTVTLALFKNKKESKPAHLVERDSKGRETRVSDIDPGNKTIVKEFYSNGLASSELIMHIRDMHAFTTLWDESGNKTATREHLCGQRNGIWQEYGDNGEVIVNECYEDDKLNGTRWYIDEDGQKIIEQYDKGRKIENFAAKPA